MKNVIKKIASIAMAFTLLGTGTTVAKNINPKSDNTLVASAACQYHDGSVRYGRVIINYRLDGNFKICKCCGKITGTTRNSKAYRVKCRFAYPKSPTGGNVTHDGGYYSEIINIYEGTILEISNSTGKCLSGRDAKTGRDLKNYDFSMYMHNLQRLY